MTCPRCGAANPIPEATKHKCHNCGYSLVGEVSRHDVHTMAARRAMLRVMLLLVVLAGIVYAAIVTEWFGLKAGPFVPSDAPTMTTLFAPDPIDYETANGTVVLKPVANISVNALLLQNHRYGDGALQPLSERDFVVAWSDIAAGDRKRVTVVPHDRTATLSSPDGQYDTKTLTSLTAVLHIIPANDNIKRVIQSVSGGAKLGIEGLVVNAAVGGQNFEGITSGSDEGEPQSMLLYVTAVTLKGKTIGLTVSE
ncbi:MAG: hypothetical protein HY976_00165 [Candidatus Kerfeldbacteria bacterium]|nr:hypothetical protein [Candidatus Kerfeldbacteria bacterium]